MGVTYEHTNASVMSPARCSLEKVIWLNLRPFLICITNSLLVRKLGVMSTNSL